MSWDRCALCPRLCRSACPVATGTGREAAVPSVIAGLMLEVERGSLPDELAKAAITLCTDCGACQEHCHLDIPLPTLLHTERVARVPHPPIEPLTPIQGGGSVIAIESDDRPFAQALAQALGVPVARWKTRDHLGVAGIHYPSFQRRAENIRSIVGHRSVVVTSGGVAQVLDAAGVGFEWLRDRVRDLPSGSGSCRCEGTRPLACCGASGPLQEQHPDEARRVGQLWLERAEDWNVLDSRCRSHLNNCGGTMRDPLDELIARMKE